MRMWRPDDDWYTAHIQTAIEGSYEIYTRRIDQRHMVPDVTLPLL